MVEKETELLFIAPGVFIDALRQSPYVERRVADHIKDFRIDPPFVPIYYDLVTSLRRLPTQSKLEREWEKRAFEQRKDVTLGHIARVGRAWASLIMEHHAYSMCVSMASEMGFTKVYKSNYLDTMGGIDCIVSRGIYRMGLRWWWNGGSWGDYWQQKKLLRSDVAKQDWLRNGNEPFWWFDIEEEGIFSQPLNGEPESVLEGNMHLYTPEHVIAIRDELKARSKNALGSLEEGQSFSQTPPNGEGAV